MEQGIRDCCAERHKERSEDEYRKLINRLNRIEGQIKGIRKMVEANAYCTDILMQSSAVCAAMNSFNKELLANHIRSCVIEDIKNGNEDESVAELVKIIQRMMK